MWSSLRGIGAAGAAIIDGPITGCGPSIGGGLTGVGGIGLVLGRAVAGVGVLDIGLALVLDHPDPALGLLPLLPLAPGLSVLAGSTL